jgi:pyruvate kinase
MKVQILCTLGPASLRPDVIRRLDERGVDLFRVNLSHTPLEALAPTIELIHGCSETPVCLDTEGAQVRCGPMAPDVTLERGRTIRLAAAGPVGTAEELILQPGATLQALRPASELSVDFNGALLRVTEAGPAGATAVVLEGGRVRSNKAVTVDPAPALPALTRKDTQAIEVASSLGVRQFALSFASCAEDVALVRGLVGPDATVISKIESRAGIRNMDTIISASDAVLIDRGDLSREIPLEHVPSTRRWWSARPTAGTGRCSWPPICWSRWSPVAARRWPRPTTSPTRSWTASTGWCWPPRRRSVWTRWGRWTWSCASSPPSSAGT